MYEEKINKSIGNMIRVMRKAMQMTQEALAKKIGISIQQVHKYETGQDTISVLKLQTIANIFGCDISVLLPKQEAKCNNILKIAQKKDSLKIAKKSPNNEAISLLKSFFECNKNDREKIINFAKNLAKNK